MNKNQNELLEYFLKNNPNAEYRSAVLQGGPGAGKSFVAHQLCIDWARREGRSVHIIIFKHDLLGAYPEAENIYTQTLCSFWMRVFDLKYYEWRTKEAALSGSLSEYDFLMVIFNTYRRLRIFFRHICKDTLYVFDEYTVISKILLIPLLCALNKEKVSHLFVGDRAQLQAIHNSSLLKAIPNNYGIVSMFVEKVVVLNVNMRCSNINHNELLNRLARNASEESVPAETFLLLAIGYPAKVMYKLYQLSDYDLIHISGKHRANTVRINALISTLPEITKKYHVAFNVEKTEHYIKIEPNNVYISFEAQRNLENPLEVGKHLPYLPLKIGGKYFMYKRSESSIGTLVRFDNKYCYLETSPGHIHEVGIGKLRDILYHEEICFGPDKSNYYNFQIAPSNIMSIHASQGRTINGKVSIDLSETTRHGAYVALSRSRDPDDIVSINIDNELEYLMNAFFYYPTITKTPIMFADIKLPKILYKLPQDQIRTIGLMVYNMVKNGYESCYEEFKCLVQFFPFKVLTNQEEETETSTQTDLLDRLVHMMSDIDCILDFITNAQDASIFFMEYLKQENKIPLKLTISNTSLIKTFNLFDPNKTLLENIPENHTTTKNHIVFDKSNKQSYHIGNDTTTNIPKYASHYVDGFNLVNEISSTMYNLLSDPTFVTKNIQYWRTLTIQSSL